MLKERIPINWQVLLPVGIGTSLSLLGDASLYAVLPTHTATAGVSVASVGILLSANRFIRLILNGPGGVVYDRCRRRPLFLAALFVGACSTALYGQTTGFWPLLLGRLLWGLAWVGIWVGGNKIVLDVAGPRDRGRWIGIYNLFFFLGSASGSLLGGLLTDRLGYHQAMNVSAGLTFLGWLVALVVLPETRGLRLAAVEPRVAQPSVDGLAPIQDAFARQELVSAIALYGLHRLAMAGVLSSTFALFLRQQLGDPVGVAGQSIGVTTLTGLGLSVSTVISALSAPTIGGLSDRWGNRWRVAAGALLPGVIGFSLLAVGLPLTILVGLPLAAITGGSNQGLATALVGDLAAFDQQGRRLGLLFTVGDLASAVGPPLAYTLLPFVGISSLYLLITALFLTMSLLLFATARRQVALGRDG
jgi:MFS family permease